MIEKITKEQEEQIPVYIKKWVDVASMPIDRSKTVKITKELFGEEKTVLVAESIQNAIDIIKHIAGDKSIKYDSQLNSELNSQLDSELDSQLDSQLRSELFSQLDSQLNSQLDSQLNSQLNSQLRSQLPKEISYSYYTTQFWLTWLGYYDFAKSIGVKFDEEKLERMTDVVLSIPTVITLGEILIIIENPTCSWSNGNLHSETEPAISWKDGTGIYFLNAVRFKKELWEKVVKTQSEGGLSFADRMKIEDVDQRTQAINPKFADIDLFIKEAKGELLDEYNKLTVTAEELNYKLYKFPKGDIFTEDAYYCYFDCPATRKKHLEGVEISKTVPEAMSWAEEISEEEWKLRVPLVHEF